MRANTNSLRRLRFTRLALVSFLLDSSFEGLVSSFVGTLVRLSEVAPPFSLLLNNAETGCFPPPDLLRDGTMLRSTLRALVVQGC